jgi:hypothetical protein
MAGSTNSSGREVMMMVVGGVEQHVLLLALDDGFNHCRVGRSFGLPWRVLVFIIHNDDGVGRKIFKEAPVAEQQGLRDNERTGRGRITWASPILRGSTGRAHSAAAAMARQYKRTLRIES